MLVSVYPNKALRVGSAIALGLTPDELKRATGLDYVTNSMYVTIRKEASDSKNDNRFSIQFNQATLSAGRSKIGNQPSKRFPGRVYMNPLDYDLAPQRMRGVEVALTWEGQKAFFHMPMPIMIPYNPKINYKVGFHSPLNTHTNGQVDHGHGELEPIDQFRDAINLVNKLSKQLGDTTLTLDPVTKDIRASIVTRIEI